MRIIVFRSRCAGPRWLSDCEGLKRNMLSKFRKREEDCEGEGQKVLNVKSSSKTEMLKVRNSKGRLNHSKVKRGDVEDPFTGKADFFSGNFLPSEGEVFNHFRLTQLNSELKGEDGKYKSSTRVSLMSTAEAVGKVWCKGPYPTISVEGIIKRIQKTQLDVQDLHRNITKSTAGTRSKETAVKERLKRLFDISVKDWRSQIRRDRGISEEGKRRAEEDIQYLERCQRGEKVGPFGAKDHGYNEKIQRRIERHQREEQRVTKQIKAPAVQGQLVEDGLGGDIAFSARSSRRGDDGENYQPPKKLQKENDTFSPLSPDFAMNSEVLEAADACQLSNNTVCRILAPIAKMAGLTPDQVVLSNSTVRRRRREVREKGSQEVLLKIELQFRGEVVTLGWDEKKMLNHVKEGVDIKAKVIRDEMLAIVISCPAYPEGKTVAIIPMEKGKGKGADVAERTWRELEKAGLSKLSFGGLAFDTTSKNSGVIKGAAKLLQVKYIKTEVLYLACRHHVFEIVLGAVWGLLMGETKSSEDTFCNKVANEFPTIDTSRPFKVLPSLDPTLPPALEQMRESSISFLNSLLTNPNSKDQIPREDYREAFELALVMLDSPPPRWKAEARWRKCGATSHARCKFIFILVVTYSTGGVTPSCMAARALRLVTNLTVLMKKFR